MEVIPHSSTVGRRRRLRSPHALLASLLMAVAGVGTPGPAEALRLALSPDLSRPGQPGPGSCSVESGTAQGWLAAEGPGCRSARLGTATAEVGAGEQTAGGGAPSQFTSAPMKQTVQFSGRASIVVYYNDFSGGGALSPKKPLNYRLEELTPSDEVILIAVGEAIANLCTGCALGRNEGEFRITPYTLPAGSRLRLLLGSTHPEAAAGEIKYGKDAGGGDSAIEFGTLKSAGIGGSGGGDGGALSPLEALLFAGLWLLRRRRLGAGPIGES